MDIILLYGFTGSERFICRERFLMMFPHASFAECDALEDVDAEAFSAAVIHCRYCGWEAMETALKFAGRNKKSVLFSARVPNAVLVQRAFLEAEDRPEHFLLLFCPESLTDITGCAEAVAGKRPGFVSSAALRMKQDNLLSGFMDIHRLSKIDLGIIHGILDGRMDKEIASGLTKSLHYIESRMNILKDRYEILRSPQKIHALLDWFGI
jgi:hypothetical protein